MMERHPRRAAGGVEERIEERPVGHGVGAVGHRFGFAIRRRDAAGVQMIAADDDRRLELARPYHLVEREAGEMALAQPQPADARGQALERDALARHPEPAMQMRIGGKELLHLAIGLVDVLGIAGQRHPAERPLAFAEQRADVGRHEARKGERVRDAFVERDLADVVAVVERRERPGRETRASRSRARRSTASPRRRVPRAAARRPAPLSIARRSSRRADNRRRDRARRSGRSPCRAATLRRTSSGRISAALPSRPTDTGALRAQASRRIASASSRSFACRSR